MAKLSKFDETKIKMVMKLRGVSREVAMRELHIDATARQKAEDSSVSVELGEHLCPCLGYGLLQGGLGLLAAEKPHVDSFHICADSPSIKKANAKGTFPQRGKVPFRIESRLGRM